jgi:hypothetical protein
MVPSGPAPTPPRRMEREKGLGSEKENVAGFFLEDSMATASSCHCSTSTSDAGAGVAGFGPLVHSGSSLGTQIVVFLV